MDKLLSIIVPTYNMEALLRQDLQSLIVEDAMPLLEVVVINDGSKDSSLTIAREFEDKYASTFKIIDKPNGNYGSCINAALKVVSGKYVRIMDADDSFDTEVFASFLKELEQIDVDIIFNDYAKEWTSGRREVYSFDIPQHQILLLEDVIDNKAFQCIQLPSLTYRRNIFRALDYHQTEGISYTDMEWCFSPVSQVKTVYYIPGVLYKYLMGREGQTMNPEAVRRGMSHKALSLTNMVRSSLKIRHDETIDKYFTGQLVRHLEDIYRLYLVDYPHDDRAALKTLDSELKKYDPEAYRLSGEIPYRLHLKYRHISDWRRRNYVRIPLSVRMKECILDILGKLHVKLCNIEQ